jgi:hypothetical protein
MRREYKLPLLCGTWKGQDDNFLRAPRMCHAVNIDEESPGAGSRPKFKGYQTLGEKVTCGK